jgi:proteic killer suppression protein
MILSFRDRDTERFHNGARIAAFQGFAMQARQKLNNLDDATSLSDLIRKRGNRLEALSGNRQGQYSIRVNRQWRVCFRWLDDGPHDVEIVDYH